MNSLFVSAVLRGGNWNNGRNAGLFSANLNNAPSNTNWNIGFRCPPEHQRFLRWWLNSKFVCDGEDLLHLPGGEGNKPVRRENCGLPLSHLRKGFEHPTDAILPCPVFTGENQSTAGRRQVPMT